MKKLHFTYDMQIDYSMVVTDCHFTIKCIPVDTHRQKIKNYTIEMYPDSAFQWGRDGFGNTQIWGVNEDEHVSFRFRIFGDVLAASAEYECAADDDLTMVYGHPHGLNRAGDTIKLFYKEHFEKTDASTYDRVAEIMGVLHEHFTYKKGVTGVNTPAEQAFMGGCGVCQDYAHIMISLLHLSGIPARYVTGFIIGEGASHAWVEFIADGRWIGADPTHNRFVDEDYIKLGHGRDAKDCLINKGIMHGGGTHTQTVSVSVQDCGKVD